MNRSLDCRAMLESLSDYIDGSLREDLCRTLEDHLSGCRNCRVVVDTMKKTIYLYQATADTGVPEAVRERLYRRLDLEDFLH